MKTSLSIILCLVMRVVCKPTMDYIGAIEAMPPSVTVSAMSDRRIADAYGINLDSLTNPLYQVILDETDNKRRVQRYRGIDN